MPGPYDLAGARKDAPKDPTSLPKWAQKQIAHKTEEIACLNARIKELTGPVKSQVIVETTCGNEVHIPSDARVRFALDPRHDVETLCSGEWIEVRIREGKLHLYGGGSLAFEPLVTNVCNVKVLPR